LAPIRHRKEDLPIFFQRFAQEFAAASKIDPVPVIPASVTEAMCRYDWPGNVREIRNVMERLILLSAGREIQLSDLPEKIVRPKPALADKAGSLITLEAATKHHIEQVLAAEPNLDKAAEILGITKVTLWRRRKEYGLP
jgi:NtrC-family two-component system response regulator AlgB